MRIGPSYQRAGQQLTSPAMDMQRTAQGSVAGLIPIMGMVLIAFLVVGLAMPVLPLHVHEGLGLSTFVVGLVAGSQFAASLVSRVWAGRHADLRGAKHAVVAGLVASTGAGLLYLLSLHVTSAPANSLAIQSIGHELHCAGDGFIVMRGSGRGLGLTDRQ